MIGYAESVLILAGVLFSLGVVGLVWSYLFDG